MKMVLTTKLSRYKDWYGTTNFDDERIDWNDRMGLYKLMCKNWTAVTIFSITVICFKGSEEESGTALYGYD